MRKIRLSFLLFFLLFSFACLLKKGNVQAVSWEKKIINQKILIRYKIKNLGSNYSYKTRFMIQAIDKNKKILYVRYSRYIIFLGKGQERTLDVFFPNDKNIKYYQFRNIY